MQTTSFYNGVSPALWYSTSLYNQTFGTSYSPLAGLTGPITVNSSYNQNASAALSALNGLYSRTYDVLQEADSLAADNSESALFRQQAASGNTGMANVVYFDGNNYLGDVPDSTFSFNVTQIAQSQISLGQLFANPSAGTTINTGVNTFRLTYGSTQTNLSVTINAGETWESALTKMATAINDAQDNVTATVLSGTGGVQLKLEGQTGAANTFSLADVSGNAVAQSGPYNVSQTAQNAIFTVNDASYDQPNNGLVLLEGNLLVNVTGAGQTTVTVSPDTSAMIEKVGDLVEAMNDLSSYLASNQYLSASLSRRWSSLLNQAASNLSGYGFSLGNSLQLTLDTTELASALATDLASARLALGGPAGLTADIKTFADRIASSPGAYSLASPPSSGYGAMYLRSFTSAPRFRVGSSLFWRTA
ncbi:MAG: flagellar filament capping protein FliD [Thermodesulfobacteriota bacterium]